MIYRPEYKEIFPSIYGNYCIHTDFSDYLKKHNIVERIHNDFSILDIDAVRMRALFKTIAQKYIPEADRKSILENLDRFGVGNAALYIEG